MPNNNSHFLDSLFAKELLIYANHRCLMHSLPQHLRRNLELRFRRNTLIMPIYISRRIQLRLIYRGKLCSILVQRLLCERVQYASINFKFGRSILCQLNKVLDHLPLTCVGTIDSLTADEVRLQHEGNDVLYSHFFPQYDAFVTGGKDGTVTLWDRSKACVKLRGHDECITSLQFHPSNPSIVATASRDFTAKLWQLSAGKSSAICIGTMDQHSARITCIAFHPNRSLLLTGSDDETAKLWKLSSDDSPATCIDTLEDHVRMVTFVEFHPIAPFMVTISDSCLAIWNMPTDNSRSECIDSVEVDSGVQSVALHPRDPFLAVGCKSGDIILIQLDPDNFTIKSTNALDVRHTRKVMSIAFHQTAPVLAAISTDAVNLWELSDDYLSATCVATIPQNNRGTHSFSVEFDAKRSILYTKIGTNYQVWR
jgi:WD40 repeat protein